tara:strand:+ start:8541 stop:8798 length:258 start_codon:yes stop_codon:yes gene_type:complete
MTDAIEPDSLADGGVEAVLLSVQVLSLLLAHAGVLDAEVFDALIEQSAESSKSEIAARLMRGLKIEGRTNPPAHPFSVIKGGLQD